MGEIVMRWPNFTTTVPGKWVLAGEHSVLRGATAVALPQRDLGLTLSFEPHPEFSAVPVSETESRLGIEPVEAEIVIKELLHSVADRCAEDSRVFDWPNGKLKIRSNIPVGAGLGSSAALCVALTRWMAEPLGVEEAACIEFATRLEHRFHGRSSGMDVAVIVAEQPISFAMDGRVRSLGIQNIPKFTFHDTGLRTRTSECVLRVEKFREEVPNLGVKVDETMAAASRAAMEGLIRYDSPNLESRREGLQLIKKGMEMARECFYSWELVPGDVKRMEEDLLKKGALAVKLTGAGGGGVLVALWDSL